MSKEILDEINVILDLPPEAINEEILNRLQDLYDMAADAVVEESC